MKRILRSLVVLVGIGGVAAAQGNNPMPSERPTHPGTAILDSMGIFAGTPDQAVKRDASTTPALPTVPATRTGAPAGKQ